MFDLNASDFVKPFSLGNLLQPFGDKSKRIMEGASRINNALGYLNSTDALAGPSGSSTGSYSFEEVAAKLRPFREPDGIDERHPAYPILRGTQGLVFPYNPTISEGVSISYDRVDLTHSNEAYHAYKSTENPKINISDAVWTCDTFENAVYALAVLHFFRMYSFMDFGRGRTGRPPSPMWFSAYGNYIYRNVPVILEKADWSFPKEVDYVGVPEFGTTDYNNKQLATSRGNGTGRYSWMPVQFTISSITLVVQHSPSYWSNWDIDAYWSGDAISRGTAHTTGGV